MPNHHDIRQEDRQDDRAQDQAHNDDPPAPAAGLQRRQIERREVLPAPLRLVRTIVRRNTPTVITYSQLAVFILGDLGLNWLANLGVVDISDPIFHPLAVLFRDGFGFGSLSIIGVTLTAKLIIDAWHLIRNANKEEDNQ